MRLTTVTNVSLDGVMQGHRRIDAGTRREAGAPDADGSGGFERFGWAPPLLDDEASTFISRALQRADAFLFGRWTYEIFAGSWGAGVDPGNPVGEALNTRPKYVASTTLTDPRWADTTVLSGDVAAAIGELRAEPGGELQVWGSGTLIRWLLEHGWSTRSYCSPIPLSSARERGSSPPPARTQDSNWSTCSPPRKG
jgi:dihydrofolate reductase